MIGEETNAIETTVCDKRQNKKNCEITLLHLFQSHANKVSS